MQINALGPGRNVADDPGIIAFAKSFRAPCPTHGGPANNRKHGPRGPRSAAYPTGARMAGAVDSSQSPCPEI